MSATKLNGSLALRSFLPLSFLSLTLFLAPAVFAQSEATEEPAASSDDAPSGVTQSSDDDATADDATDNQQQADEKDALTHLLGMSIMQSEEEEGVVLVKEVDPLEPAWDAGVRPGDRLKKVQGIPTKPYERFIEALREIALETKEGDRIPIVVERKGEEANLQITQRSNEKTDVKEAVKRREREKAMEEQGLTSPGSLSPGDAAAGAAAVGATAGAQASAGVDDAGVPLDAGQRRADPDSDPLYTAPGLGINSTASTSGQTDPLQDAEFRQLRRLNRMRLSGEWTAAQQQQYLELFGRYAGAPSGLDPLSRQEQRILDNLQEQQRSGDQLSTEQQSQLTELQQRQEESLFGGPAARLLAERDMLEDIYQEGDVSAAERNRLEELRRIDEQFGLSQDRSSEDGLFGPSGTQQDYSDLLNEREAQRRRELMSRGDQLSQTEANELRQLQRRASFLGDRQQRNEFRMLRRQAQTQTGLTRAQEQRLGNLRQQQIDQLNRINRATGGQLSNFQQAQQAAQQRAQSNLTTGPGAPATAGQSIGQGSGIGLPNGGAGGASGGAGGAAAGGAAGGSGGSTEQ